MTRLPQLSTASWVLFCMFAVVPPCMVLCATTQDAENAQHNTFPSRQELLSSPTPADVSNWTAIALQKGQDADSEQTNATVPPDGGVDIFSHPLPSPIVIPSPSPGVQQNLFSGFSFERTVHTVPGGAIVGPDTEGGQQKPPKTIPTPSPTPPPPDIARRDHSTVLLEGDKLLIFGGLDQYHRLRNDIWMFIIHENKWASLPSQGWTRPSRRCRHTAVMRYNHMVVFGGNNGWHFLNDVWRFDVDSLEWSKLRWYGRGPSRRERTAAVYANNRMYVVGGYGGWHYNDVWEFRFDRNAWARKWTFWGKRPRGRASHGIAFEEYIYIFGGVDWWTIFNDMWRFDIKTNMWQEIVPDGPRPPPRCSLTMVSRGKIFVFGGWGGRSELNDLWEWSLTTNSWEPIPFDNRFARVPFLQQATGVLRGDDFFVHGGWSGTGTSARTYALDVVHGKARSVGWTPKVIRMLTKDSPEVFLSKYNQM